MTHSEATEKPVARARAGWPATSATRMPGPSIAERRRRSTQLNSDRDHDVRRQREADRQRPTWPTATRPRKRISPRMSPRNRRVTMRAPSTSPTSWNGSAIAAATPRARSSRSNSCSYISEASATNPMSAVARNGRLHQSRCRRLDLLHGPPALGERRRGLLGVRSPRRWRPSACRSQPPRTGSRRRSARNAKITVGIDEDEERHPPAERVGEQPGRQRTDERADRVGGAVRAEHACCATRSGSSRRAASCASDRSTALPIALPLRAMVSRTTPVARPVMPAEHRPHAARRRSPAAPAASGRRTGRSAPAARARRPTRAATRPSTARVVEVELVADVRQQDAERGAVELVDGVQPEQHDERVRRLAAAHLAQPRHRVARRAAGTAHAGPIIGRTRLDSATDVGRPARHVRPRAGSRAGTVSATASAAREQAHDHVAHLDPQAAQAAGQDQQDDQHADAGRQQLPLLRR